MFVCGQGDSEGIHVWYSVSVTPLSSSSFTLTIVRALVFLTCRCSMSDLSAACWSVLLSGLPCPPSFVRHEPRLDTLSVSWRRAQRARSCLRVAASGDSSSPRPPERLLMDVLNDLLFLTVASCLFVCCHALCYAEVNVRMLMSCCHIIRGFFFFLCFNPQVFLYCSKIIDGGHCWCMDVT